MAKRQFQKVEILVVQGVRLTLVWVKQPPSNLRGLFPMATRLLAVAGCAFLMLAGPMQADNPLRSGPPVGSPNDRSGFLPNWVSGPTADKQLCPV
jgi:hypothetical protein